MSIKCPNCEQEMDDNSPFTPAEVANAVEQETSWDSVYYAFSRQHPLRHIVVQLRGKATQVNVVEKIRPENMPKEEYARQGETYKAFLILEVGGSYFRKEAHVDSYAEESWTGPLIRVNRIEKTVQVWE